MALLLACSPQQGTQQAIPPPAWQAEGVLNQTPLRHGSAPNVLRVDALDTGIAQRGPSP